MRVRGSGYYIPISMIAGHRAQRVKCCVKCGTISAGGGIRRDSYYVAPPAERGDARDVLKWIDEQMPRGRWLRCATDYEIRLFGVSWCRKNGLMPPMGGGAVNIWKAASASTWNTPGNWSTGVVPQAGDTVQIGSGTGATQSNCTVDVNTANLADLNCTSYTGTLTLNTNISVAATTTIRLVSTMGLTMNSGSNFITEPSSGNTCSVWTGGKNVSSDFWIGVIGAGTTSLQDNWVNCTGRWVMNGGTLTTNGVTANIASVGASAGATGMTVNLGASALTLTGANQTVWASAAYAAVNAGTSTITCTGATATFAGNSYAFNSVAFSGSGTATITGANTFANLTRTGTANQTDAFAIGATQTITGTLTLTGNSTKNRLSVNSGAATTARTFAISGGTINATNADYRDITITGSPTQNITSVGDVGGNTGVTFTASSPQAWQSTSGGSWSVASNWTSRIPLPQDNVTISKAFIASQTITMDMPRVGRNIDFTGTTGSPTLSITVSPTITGSLTLAAGLGTMSWSAGLTMVAYSNVTLTTAGKQPNNSIVFQSPLTSTLTLQDDVTIAGSGIFFLLQGGTVNANGHNITAPGIFLGQFGLAWAATMGSGTWTATGSGVNAFAANANGSLTAGTSTLVLSDTTATGKTFTGGGYTYNNVSFTGGGTGAVTVVGSNTINTLTVGLPKTVSFTAGTAQNITTLVATGSSGNLIVLQSATASSTATINVTNRFVGNWLTITDITGGGTTPLYAGNNSTLTRTVNWVKGTSSLSNDSLALSDSAVVSTTFSRSTSESLSVSDSTTRISQSLSRVTSESESVSDSTNRNTTFARATSDSSLISDSTSRLVVFVRSSGDATILGDSVIRSSYAFSRQSAEIILTTDSTLSSIVLSRDVFDIVGVSDSSSRNIVDFLRSVSDVVSVTESSRKTIFGARSTSDLWVAVDLTMRSLGLARTLGTDQILIFEVVHGQVSKNFTALDHLTIGDWIVVGSNTSALDSWALSDSTVSHTSRARRGSESLSVADSVVRLVFGPRNGLETLRISDRGLATLGFFRNSLDSWTVGDVVVGIVTPAAQEEATATLVARQYASAAMSLSAYASAGLSVTMRQSASIWSSPVEDVEIALEESEKASLTISG